MNKLWFEEYSVHDLPIKNGMNVFRVYKDKCTQNNCPFSGEMNHFHGRCQNMNSKQLNELRQYRKKGILHVFPCDELYIQKIHIDGDFQAGVIFTEGLIHHNIFLNVEDAVSYLDEHSQFNLDYRFWNY